MSSNSSGSLWAVLSDIHANWPALERVIDDAYAEAKALGVSPGDIRFISLGDVVDYGPDPVKCLDWVEANCEIKLRGNHDLEASRCPPVTISQNRIAKHYWPISFWTRCQLTPAHRVALRQWPTVVDKVPGLPDFVLAHSDFRAGPQEQEDQNLVISLDAAHLSLTYDSLFKPLLTTRAARHGMVGHSHEQGVIQSLNQGQCGLVDNGIPRKFLNSRDNWTPLPSGNLVINPGGVGQPRWSKFEKEFDPRAQYLLVDSRHSEIRYKLRRIKYHPEKTTVPRLRLVTFPDLIPDGCQPRVGDEAVAPLTVRDLQRLKDELPALCNCLGERLLSGKMDSCLDKLEE